MPAPQMEESPPIPPAVAGQMGGPKPPFAGVGAQMASKPPAGGPTPGGADSSGALKSAADAVTKVIDNMASMDKEGAPFAARIKQMLESWMTEAAKRGPGSKQMAPMPGGEVSGGAGVGTEGHGFIG